MLVVNRRIRIPLREFTFRFTRSSGAGGQNVNKVATKVTLRWDVANSPSLPRDVRERFFGDYRRRISKEGEFILTSQRFRDQGRNVADCIEKLRAMLEAVASPPKRRKPSKPSAAARERRMREKHIRADKKRQRRRVDEA